MSAITGKQLYEMASAAEIVHDELDAVPWKDLPERIQEQCNEIASSTETPKVKAERGAVAEV
jgi:hypothetical protein